MLSRWWCPWILPVMMLGSILLLTRPVAGVVCLVVCVLIGRGINAVAAHLTGQTAPGTHLYLR